MAVVKGSPQDRLIIRHYQPWQKFRRNLLLLMVFALIGAGGYVAGIYDSMDSIGRLTSERDQLGQSLLDSEREINRLNQRVGVLEKGGEVDRRANEGIRQTVKDLKAQIARLEEEVTFYKAVMAPGSKEKGLRISKVLISEADQNGYYGYSIMVTQMVDKRRFVSGTMQISIAGQQEGKDVVIPVKLSGNISDIKFRFRYFQELTGRFVLPETFIPGQVQILLIPAGNRAKRVEHTVDWPIQNKEV